ncbi:lamin tail domain-containing protein [Amycolatopsis sp. NPDC089917]|uniref:lamin tail domain-containing protein n=1 Tax=Amycolatopsis sp. NPDC089917 TaxID=3155187 RepID=UPI0034252FD9
MMRNLVGGVLGVLALSVVTATPSDARDLTPQVSTTVLINEILAKGTNGELDEFLELRNVSTVPVNLSGFSLRFYSSAYAPTAPLPLPPSLVLQATNSVGQYVVLIGQDFTGTIHDQTNVVPVTNSGDLMPARRRRACRSPAIT